MPEYDDDFEDDFEDDDEDGDDSDTVVEPHESPTKTVRAGPVASQTAFLRPCPDCQEGRTKRHLTVMEMLSTEKTFVFSRLSACVCLWRSCLPTCLQPVFLSPAARVSISVFVLCHILVNYNYYNFLAFRTGDCGAGTMTD